MAEAALSPNTKSAGKSFGSSAYGFFKHGDIIFSLGIISLIIILLIPLNKIILDFLLAVSITISVLILLTVLFLNKPLEFSSFPTVLLIATLMRLALNIASTRLILTEGHKGTASAGKVIQAFGGFVMEGSVVIGLIVFMILTIINFVVITKGSGRIAEVSARFSLDAMPGKQMAIDADLSAGLINEEVAKARRKELEDESSFFGAMDGASKFVRGDAIAGLLITFINMIAGMIIGIAERDLSFQKALQTYTNLTIGDGLVSQIPSLIVSLAAGILISKAGITGRANRAIMGQLGKSPEALYIVSGLLFILSLIPSMPFMVFFSLSAITAFIAWYTSNYDKFEAEAVAEKALSEGTIEQEQLTQEQEMAKALQIDTIKLELGYSILSLINYQKGHRLTDQIKALRKQLARDLGFIMPSVRIQDNMQLQGQEYVIKIKDIECARNVVKPDKLLVMDPKGQPIQISGEDTKEPAFGLPAKWINEENREDALFNNYTVVDPPTVITTHLTEIIKENIVDLLTYSETKALLDNLDEDVRRLADDIIPSQISMATLQRILQNLLSENVSVKDLPTILEAISEICKQTQNINMLTEYVRSRLSRQISFSNVTDRGYIPVVILSPTWEQAFSESISNQGNDRVLSMQPSKLQDFIEAVNKTMEAIALKGEIPVIVTTATSRPFVRSIIERFRPRTVILSQNEIHPKIKIKTLGQI